MAPQGQVPSLIWSGVVLASYCSYAPINVKPEGWGGGGSGNPREFDCGVYPQGGDFNQTLCILSFNFIE